MNARGIPAQSEDENLEKEFSYTINEMTGEKVPYGQEPKHQPATTLPPTGTSAAEQSSSEIRANQVEASQERESKTAKKSSSKSE